MFCSKCGVKLPDEARFCFQCGASVQEKNEQLSTEFMDTKVKFVPAKCTNCGAALEVDANQKAAICPYCKSAYIVEQAINNVNIDMKGNVNVGNATINVSGFNVDNLLARAKEFERTGDLKNALDYYNRVLDIDTTIDAASAGLSRVKTMIENYVYFETNANSVFTSGKLQLKKDYLVFVSNKGKESKYNVNSISDLQKSMLCIEFKYPGKILAVSYGCSDVTKMIEMVQQAQKGIYPPIK